MRHIASCSFGKDSMATILLALEKGEPLDCVLYCEVMFAKEISGEVPEHRDFIYNTAIPWIENNGIHVHVVKTENTFLDRFFHIKTSRSNPENIGKFEGFPICGRCSINNMCKINALKKYKKENFASNVIEYVGIAADEPKRLERLAGNKISLLYKYGMTEKMAKEICKKEGLLSPIYQFSRRNGCWFCPNKNKRELQHLRKNHRELWDLLIWLEKAPNKADVTFNWRDYLWELDWEFELEDRQMMLEY